MSIELFFDPGHVYEARVLRVKDGDSVVARIDDDWTVEAHGRSIDIRLMGIDAPELSQPLGREAKEALQRLLSRRAGLVVNGTDYYGRYLGMFLFEQPVGPPRFDDSINREITRQGLAYWYRRYADGNVTGLAQAECEARLARRGVWLLPEGGERPWDFRRREGHTERDIQVDIGQRIESHHDRWPYEWRPSEPQMLQELQRQLAYAREVQDLEAVRQLRDDVRRLQEEEIARLARENELLQLRMEECRVQREASTRLQQGEMQRRHREDEEAQQRGESERRKAEEEERRRRREAIHRSLETELQLRKEEERRLEKIIAEGHRIEEEIRLKQEEELGLRRLEAERQRGEARRERATRKLRGGVARRVVRRLTPWR